VAWKTHPFVSNERVERVSYPHWLGKGAQPAPGSQFGGNVRYVEETWLMCVLSHSILPSAMVTIRAEGSETIYFARVAAFSGVTMCLALTGRCSIGASSGAWHGAPLQVRASGARLRRSGRRMSSRADHRLGPAAADGGRP
jgi:hypothetical protein